MIVKGLSLITALSNAVSSVLVSKEMRGSTTILGAVSSLNPLKTYPTQIMGGRWLNSLIDLLGDDDSLSLKSVDLLLRVAEEVSQDLPVMLSEYRRGTPDPARRLG